MEDKKKVTGKFMQAAWLFVMTGAVTGAAAYLYGREAAEIVRNTVMALAGSGIILYLLAFAEEKKDFAYDNGEHRLRFLAIYSIALLLSVVLPLIPSAGWPYLAVFIALSLFGNGMIGIASGTLFLMITILTGMNFTVSDFFMYFVCGLAGIVLFWKLDEAFKVSARILLSLLVLLVCLSANYILLVNEVLSVQLFLVPVINIFVSLLLIMIFLKYFSISVMHKYRERYMDLNDPECPLLVALKEKDREEYFHAVHTAYLCDRVAKKLGVNDTVAKAGGYYHRIGKLNGDNSWDNIEKISEEYHFPPELENLLREYKGKAPSIISKEAVILMLSDAIIASISSLFRRDANATLDYHLIIDTVFKKRIGAGLINSSIITMEEISRIKKMFLEEKLYYDFLR